MSWQSLVEGIEGVECRWNADLTTYSTFRMKSQGNLLTVKSVPALSLLLPLLNQHGVSWRPLGWGANQVLASIEKDLLIKLDLPFDPNTFETPRDHYFLPASLGLNLLTAHAVKFGLKGWESLTGIPASLGGAIFMNAGTALGEIGSLVESVNLVNEQGVERVQKIDANSFSYRKNHFVRSGEFIVAATLRHNGQDTSIPEKIRQYQEYRRQSQPLATKNCGCVFKNAAPTKQAGRLIDLTGLKGLAVGALRVSHKHANFMENTGTANADDFFELTRLINQQMRLHWGVQFELEVKAV